jgi:hypothetical protein
MIKKIKIGHLVIKGVFRHQWEKTESRIINRTEWRNKELGIFYRKVMCVGIEKKFNKSNLRPSYMFGINLIWCRMWIELNFKILELEL